MGALCSNHSTTTVVSIQVTISQRYYAHQFRPYRFQTNELKIIASTSEPLNHHGPLCLVCGNSRYEQFMSNVFVQRWYDCNQRSFFACGNDADANTKTYHTVMRWLTPVHMFILSCMGQCMELTVHVQNVIIRVIYYHHPCSASSSHFCENGITQ